MKSATDTTLPPQGYTLAWADEFDGDALDTTKWVYRTDSKLGSTQRKENVSVSDGKLILRLKKERGEDGKDYTGAGVISQRTFKYGYYESRFKVPPGRGWHTSFWMMFHDASGSTNTQPAMQEIDVCENDSHNLSYYETNIHKWTDPYRMYGPHRVDTPDLSANFHVWGCEFTPREVRMFFEGRLVQSYDASLFEHGDNNIWLTSIAFPKAKPEPMEDAKLPATAEFDYVRFYEKR